LEAGFAGVQFAEALTATAGTSEVRALPAGVSVRIGGTGLIRLLDDFIFDADFTDVYIGFFNLFFIASGVSLVKCVFFCLR
jgi:hypothetical protein